MRVKLSIGGADGVTLSSRDAEAIGVAQGGEVEVVSVRGGFVLVTAKPASGGWFAGSLQGLPFAEVAQLITSTLRSGTLSLAFGRVPDPRSAAPQSLRRKTIAFREGQIVFASSSDPADRLGPVLWRAGNLSLHDLERASLLVREGRPLGRVLVEQRLISPAQLYQGVARQVREIVVGCCLEREGEFTFRDDDREERNAVKLAERPRELLLVGLKRANELERLLANEIPDPGAPIRRLAAGPAELDFRAARLLACADGRPLRAAIASAQLGAYEGLRAAASLVRANLISVPARPADERGSMTPPPLPKNAPKLSDEEESAAFDRYQRILQRLYEALCALEPRAGERLNGYLDALPDEERALFDGVRFDASGDIDVTRVLVNVDVSGRFVGAAVRARALDALDAFLSFVLFEVKNVFPRQEAEALAKEVHRMKNG